MYNKEMPRSHVYRRPRTGVTQIAEGSTFRRIGVHSGEAVAARHSAVAARRRRRDPTYRLPVKRWNKSLKARSFGGSKKRSKSKSRKSKKSAKSSMKVSIMRNRLSQAQPQTYKWQGWVNAGGPAMTCLVNKQVVATIDSCNDQPDLVNVLTKLGISNQMSVAGATAGVPLPGLNTKSIVRNSCYQTGFHSSTEIVNTCTVPIKCTFYYCKPRADSWLLNPGPLSNPLAMWTGSMNDFSNATQTSLGSTPFQSHEFCHRVNVYKTVKKIIEPGCTFTVYLKDNKLRKLDLEEIYGNGFTTIAPQGPLYYGKNSWGSKQILMVMEGTPITSVVTATSIPDNLVYTAPVTCRTLNRYVATYKMVEPLQAAQVFQDTPGLVALPGGSNFEDVNIDVDHLEPFGAL